MADADAETINKKSNDFETTREGVIFCIDVSSTMFGGVDEHGLCFLQRCFKCVRDRMLHNIMLSDKEYIGIMLMASKAKSSNSNNTCNGINGFTSLFDIARPNAEIIKTLNRYIKSNNFRDEFEENFEIDVECTLADALWDCQSRLSLCDVKFGPKELFIMTCNELKDADDTMRRHACRRANALMQIGISLRLLYLGESFDINAFYKELLLAAHPHLKNFKDDAEKFAAINVDLLPDTALTRSSFNRHQFRLDWFIADGVNITVLLFSNIRSQDVYEPRKIVQLDQRTNLRVTSKSSYFDNETGDVVEYHKLYKGVTIGDRPAIFTTKEQSNMRNLHAAGIYLLGFKPINAVILEDFIKPGVLLQPDDITRKGSSSLFHALLKKCLSRQVVPLCRMVLRAGTSARLAYLLPQEHGDASLGTLGVAGFQVYYSPFAGECRPCGEVQELEAEPEQINLVSKIIKKLEIAELNIQDYKNPAQRTFFSGVEALALDLEEPQEIIDPLVPDSSIGPRIERFVNAFLESVEKTNMDIDDAETSSISQSSSTSSSKKSSSGRGRGRKNTK